MQKTTTRIMAKSKKHTHSSKSKEKDIEETVRIDLRKDIKNQVEIVREPLRPTGYAVGEGTGSDGITTEITTTKPKKKNLKKVHPDARKCCNCIYKDTERYPKCVIFKREIRQDTANCTRFKR